MKTQTFVAVWVLLSEACLGGRQFPRGDDVDPNVAVIEGLAARLNTLEADVTAQKQRVAQLEGEVNQKVAFNVQMSERPHSISVPARQIVPFDKVTMNIGDGFDPSTHSFTAPYSGLYWLYVRADVVNNFRSFEVQRNGNGVDRCDNDSGMRAITCGVVVNLNVDDVIVVVRGNWSGDAGKIDPGPESFFTGVKL